MFCKTTAAVMLHDLLMGSHCWAVCSSLILPNQTMQQQLQQFCEQGQSCILVVSMEIMKTTCLDLCSCHRLGKAGSAHCPFRAFADCRTRHFSMSCNEQIHQCQSLLIAWLENSLHQPSASHMIHSMESTPKTC